MADYIIDPRRDIKSEFIALCPDVLEHGTFYEHSYKQSRGFATRGVTTRHSVEGRYHVRGKTCKLSYRAPKGAQREKNIMTGAK